MMYILKLWWKKQKSKLYNNIKKVENEKINLLITGATGSE